MSYFAIKRPSTPKKSGTRVPNEASLESCKAVWDYGYHTVPASLQEIYELKLNKHDKNRTLFKQQTRRTTLTRIGSFC